MAKCRCEPNPKTLALAGYQSFIGTVDKPGPLWPTEEECNPTNETAKDFTKRACEARRGLLGKHVTNEKGGDFFSPKTAAGNITVTAGDGTTVTVKQGEGEPWVFVEGVSEPFVPPKTIKPAPSPADADKAGSVPAPPDADAPGVIEGTVPENLQNFNEQCFLLEYAKPIFETFGTAPTAPENSFEQPVRSLSWIKKASGATTDKWEQNINYINHITAGAVPADTMRHFFEMTPEEKAQLVPFIQISVDYYDNMAVRKESIILDFPNHVDLDTDVLRASGQRRLAGIRSISISLDGINEVMAKVIKLNASFVFQDFRTVFKGKPKDDVVIGSGSKLRNYYSDLFSYGSRDVANDRYKKLRFKIGWSARTHTINSEKDSLTKKLGLNERTLVLDVGIEKYDFDFNIDGSVTVNISYIGTMDTSFNGPSSNLLSMVKSTMNNMQKEVAQEHANQLETITKKSESNSLESRRTQVAEMVFTMTVMDLVLAEEGGLTALYQGTSGVDRKNDRWVAPHNVFGGAVLRGRVETLLKQSSPGSEIDTGVQSIIEQIEQMYQRNFGGEGELVFHGIQPENRTREVGMTRTKLEELIGSLGGNKQNTGTGALAGSQKETREAEKTNKANIKNAAATAQAAILRQLAAVRFQGLRQVAIGLLNNQKIYFAKLNQAQKFKLSANLHAKDAIREVFSELNNAKGTILGKYPHPDSPSYAKAMQEFVTYEELMAGSIQFIPFIFVGELLDTLLRLPTEPGSTNSDNVYQLITKSHSEKFKVDLGYIYYNGPLTEQNLLKYPLYYLPISLKRLNNFFVRNIIGKELTFYSFKNFVVDLLNEFLVSAQQNCAKDARSAGAKIPSLDFIYGKTYEDRYWHKPGSPTRFSSDLAKSTFKTWFIFGTQNTVNEIPANAPGSAGVKAFGSYSFNMKNRIFHFYLGGQSRGIVKAIKLIDNTTPDLKAAIYLKQRQPLAMGKTDASSQGIYPPLVFKVEIQTLGCSTFHLGQYVFLDARQYVDAEVNRIFQISGYYRVFKVEHQAERDNFVTTITAILEESLNDFEAGRSVGAGSGESASLTVPSVDTGKRKIVTLETGDDPLYTNALKILTQQLTELNGGGKLTKESLNLEWVEYYYDLACRVTHWEDTIHPTKGVETSLTVIRSWEREKHGLGVHAESSSDMGLGNVEGMFLAKVAWKYLDNMLWGNKGGADCNWGQSKAGITRHQIEPSDFFMMILQAMLQLVQKNPTLITTPVAAGKHDSTPQTPTQWLWRYAWGPDHSHRFKTGGYDTNALMYLATLFINYKDGKASAADIQAYTLGTVVL